MKLPVPPWLIRRLIIAPLMPVSAVVLFACLLGSLALGLVWSAILVLAHRRVQLRVPRVLAYAVLYLCLETGCLIGCFVLWLATVFDTRHGARSERAHLALIRWFLASLVGAAGPLFGFRLQLHPPETGDDRLADSRPLVIIARHAGPGASFIVIYLLVEIYHRQPRIVLKRELQLDPAIDILLTRLGSRFINLHAADGRAGSEAIGDVAGELRDGDAFVVFPEGANFTPERFAAAVQRLRKRGLRAAADRAARLPNVLPPRPTGTLTALDAAPRTDVVTVVHTGYDELITPGLLWQAFPLPGPLTVSWWLTPADALPTGEEGRQAWLFDQWERVDEWVSTH